MMCVSQIIMLYILNLHSAVSQLHQQNWEKILWYRTQEKKTLWYWWKNRQLDQWDGDEQVEYREF